MPDSVAVGLLVRRLLATVFAALALWLIVAFQLFFNFHHPPPVQTDAVIMLGGASMERLPVAQQLRQSLDIPALVVSQTDTPGNASADALCQDRVPRLEGSLLCLRLDQKDTVVRRAPSAAWWPPKAGRASRWSPRATTLPAPGC